MDPATVVRNLEALLAQGKESALLRFSLGNEYLKLGEHWVAVYQLKRALELDPNYSAAWKILGKALTEAGPPATATPIAPPTGPPARTAR